MRSVAALLLLLVLLSALPVRAGSLLAFGYIGGPLSYSSLAVLKAAYGKLGIHVVAKQTPGARSLLLSSEGMLDGETHRIAALAPQYPALIRVEVPINKVEGMALSCGRAVDATDLDALRALRVGVKIGNRYAERLTEGWPRIVRLNDEEQLVEMLVEGRLDVVVGDRPWARSMAGEPGRECLRINEPPLVVIPLYNYLHMRHRGLVPAITSVLDAMRASGEMTAIRDRAFIAYEQGVRP